MKTTLEIPDALFKRVKARAAMKGLKLKDVVASALNSYLTQPETTRQEGRCPFPLVRGKGGPLLKKMSNATIARLEEEEDIERYRRSVGR
jgi:hypothetical protein